MPANLPLFSLVIDIEPDNSLPVFFQDLLDINNDDVLVLMLETKLGRAKIKLKTIRNLNKNVSWLIRVTAKIKNGRMNTQKALIDTYLISPT